MAEAKQPAAATDDSPTTSQLGAAEGTFHDGTDEGKRAFLASFGVAEDKAVMRKVDRRFLLLIGCIYVIKNVSSSARRKRRTS